MTAGITPMQERKVRIDRIIATINEAKAEFVFIDFNKLVFEIQMTYGLTEQKGKEYVETAMKAVNAHVNKDNEIVFTKEENGIN